MRTGALLALVLNFLHCTLYIHPQCRLTLAEPLQEIELFNEGQKTSPTVELLIPLLAGAADSSERYNRARDDDEPFSDIPDSVFTLGDGIRVNLDPAPLHTPSQIHKRADDDNLDYYRPRSLYLGSSEQQSERPPDIWRACQGLARERTGPAYEVLLLLCAELLDVAGPPTKPAQPLPRVSDVAESSTPCTCCGETQRLEKRARRDFMPIGEDADMVLKSMRAAQKRRQRIERIMPPPGDLED